MTSFHNGPKEAGRSEIDGTILWPPDSEGTILFTGSRIGVVDVVTAWEIGRDVRVRLLVSSSEVDIVR